MNHAGNEFNKGLDGWAVLLPSCYEHLHKSRSLWDMPASTGSLSADQLHCRVSDSDLGKMSCWSSMMTRH